MLLWSYIAEHGCTQPGNLCRPNGTCDVVIARSNISHNRSERIERCLMTMIQLPLHILTNFIHRHMTRTLYEGLHILCPSTDDQFSHRVKFGKLCSIIRICNTTRAQTIAQRESHIISSPEVTYFIKMVIKD